MAYDVYRFPNRVKQTGTWGTSPSDRVVVSTGSAILGYRTLAEAKTEHDSLILYAFQGDSVFPVFVEKDETNWIVGEATYESGVVGNELAISTSSPMGTIADGDPVTLSIVHNMDAAQRMQWDLAPSEYLGYSYATMLAIASIPVDDESGTTDTINSADAGMIKRYTNAAAVAVTLDAATTAPFHATVFQSGAGTVTLTPAGGDTLNGGAGGVALVQHESKTLIQPTEGVWELI